MNDLTLVRKNLFRKPVRTVLLLVSIFIAFLVFAVLISFNHSMSNFNTFPTRMVTLSKINFTETLPRAHFDRIARTEGVVDATHLNWFGGYYKDPKDFLPVFAVDPQSYFRVYKEDLQIPAAQREAFFKDRTAMLVAEPVAKRFGWKVGQRIPLNSNVFSQADGSHSWTFTLAGIIPTPPGSSQTGSVIVHYDYFNETLGSMFAKDRVGWIVFLTESAALNDKVIQAIDGRFANSSDETSTQDEEAFNKSFAAQLGDIALVTTLVAGSSFGAILLIVGTTMALAVRERTNEVGVMKTLGFSSGRVLRMVLAESLFLALLGAGLGMVGAVGMLQLITKLTDGQMLPMALAPDAVAWSALIAVILGLVTGAAPAAAAYKLKITDAFARR